MNTGRFLQDQAAAQVQALGNQLGRLQERIEVKDPTIHDAQDAISALRKRKDQIAKELAEMADRGPRLQAEYARIDRMLAAAAPEP